MDTIWTHWLDSQQKETDHLAASTYCHVGKKRTKYWKKALIPHMVQGRALWCPKCFAVLVSSKLVLSEKNENSDLSAFHEMTTIRKVFFLLIVSKAFASCYHSDARGKHIRIISQSVEMSRVDAEKTVNPGSCSGHFGWAALSTNRRWWGSSGYEKNVQIDDSLFSWYKQILLNQHSGFASYFCHNFRPF